MNASPSVPKWRRRWKRVPAEARSAAAASLGDLFRRRRAATLLPLALAVSLILHLAATPLLVGGKGRGVDDLAAQEGTYLSQVMQKERARAVSREVQGRLTMPPPPPEPEAVVQSALTESLTSDVAKITGDLLGVELQRDLANYVQASLKDELASAAADIATGKLSEDEIRELHRKFQEKAHEKTLAWRKEYLVQHQEERAAMSTTEWYEKDVSRTLFGNMQFELFRAYHKLWFVEFCRSEHTLHWGRWGFLDLGGFGRKAAQLRRLLKDAPASAEHAQSLAQTLAVIRGKQIFDGRFTDTYSWESAWKHHVEEYFPHRADEMCKKGEAFAALWDKALAAAAAYCRGARDEVRGTGGEGKSAISNQQWRRPWPPSASCAKPPSRPFPRTPASMRRPTRRSAPASCVARPASGCSTAGSTASSRASRPSSATWRAASSRRASLSTRTASTAR